LDFYSNFLTNNRTLGNLGTVSTYWGYGGTGFYAIGFGFPYLLDLPEDRLKCGAADFLESIDQYRLTNGLGELFQSTLPIADIKTIVAEFDTWVRVKLGCISDFETDLVETAEVGYLLDELNAVMNIRIDLEETARNEITNEDVKTNEIDDGGEDDTNNERLLRKIYDYEKQKNIEDDFDAELI